MAGRPTILICDDEPDLAELMRISLEPSYEFAEAADGAEAIDLAEQLRPDLVLLDVMMQGTSGLAVIEHSARAARPRVRTDRRRIGIRGQERPPCRVRGRCDRVPEEAVRAPGPSLLVESLLALQSLTELASSSGWSPGRYSRARSQGAFCSHSSSRARSRSCSSRSRTCASSMNVQARSRNVTSSTLRLEQGVNQLEASLRGFVISGDERFLGSWRAATEPGARGDEAGHRRARRTA